MGYDTSYHPVATEALARTLAFLAEGEPIDELVAESVRLAGVRFRANAWGLGVTRLDPDPVGFEAWLHIWGRPFFVVGETPAEVSAGVDRYLAARGDAEVDAIAREMLERIEPGLATRVSPKDDGAMPAPDDLAAGTRWKLDLLRASVVAGPDGEVTRPDGVTMPAVELLAREIPHAVLEFVSGLQPGWMDRGAVWPTELLPGRLPFEPPRSLLGPLAELDVPFFLHDTIVENTMVGGWLPAAAVPELVAATAPDGALAASLEDDEERLSLRKLHEAASDAALRGLPFVEATEIYSGFHGILN